MIFSKVQLAETIMNKVKEIGEKPAALSVREYINKAQVHAATIDTIEKEIKQTYDLLVHETERLTRKARKNLSVLETHADDSKWRPEKGFEEKIKNAFKHQKEFCASVELDKPDIDDLLESIRLYRRYLKSLIELK